MPTPLPDLIQRAHDPGYTPPVAELALFVAAVAEASDDDANVIERALARAGAAAVEPVVAALVSVEPRARARLISVLGRLGDARAAGCLRHALGDSTPLVVRRAASALGRLEPDAESELALLSALPAAALPERRAIVEALGKIGSTAAASALDALPRSDAELARRIENALTLLARRGQRDLESSIVVDRPLGAPLEVLASCRSGLSELLLSELAPLGRTRRISDSVVEVTFGGSLSELFRARTALEWGVRLPLRRGAELSTQVAEALATADARRVFSAWTRGTPRFRVEFAGAGHQRHEAWAVARAVRRLTSELVNDPRGPSWGVVVDQRGPEPYVVLVPRAFDDPRFAYRCRDVPAASHPTVAAALARVAGVRGDDVVWDPFVGSGLELVERARLGPYRRLLGTDIDARALDAARENLRAAGVTGELALADAVAHRPAGVTLILTNPPMGRRVARAHDLGKLLEAFVRHAARALTPRGRLVWLSPLPALTRDVAAGVGFHVLTGPAVDMGGFDTELQTLVKTPG
jgi:23S rRNA G2445 N2-methylase RlmL